jgi:2-desacetyl-2-hydroxyethyl bacteriochlorophyllide A dehydrogenase
MRALYLRAPREFSVIDRPDPIPGPDEAVIEVHRTGICATDIATIEGRSTVAIYPITPGHEFVGTIAEAPVASGYSPGDWVTIYPTQGCGKCAACVAGTPNHCRHFRVFGVHRDGGSFAERIAVPVDQLIPVPASLRNDRGAIIEPLAVGVHANRRAGIGKGQRLAVIGAGTIGTMIAQVARARGAATIVMADRLEARKDQCRELGFPHFAVAGEGLAGRLTSFGGPLNVVFDTVCTSETLDAAIDALNPGGTLVLLGFPHDAGEIALRYAKAYKWEVTILLSRNYAPIDFADSIALLEAGSIDAGRMITGTWSLDDFAAAYAELKIHPERHVKVMIAP